MKLTHIESDPDQIRLPDSSKRAKKVSPMTHVDYDATKLALDVPVGNYQQFQEWIGHHRSVAEAEGSEGPEQSSERIAKFGLTSKEGFKVLFGERAAGASNQSSEDVKVSAADDHLEQDQQKALLNPSHACATDRSLETAETIPAEPAVKAIMLQLSSCPSIIT